MATTDRRFGLSIGTAIKPACYVASTANLVLSSSQVVDGLAVGSSQRVLVKDQTEPTENGIYNAKPLAWSRSLDLNGTNDAIPGTLAYVDRGTANAASFWVLNSSSTATTVAIEGYSTGDDLVWSNITGLISGDASAATVIATGSTAPRALNDRFADVINVKDHDATGDGVTDDTSAIQAAIDAAEVLAPATVFIPAGTYVTSSTLTCDVSKVALVGAGPYQTVIEGNFAAGDILHIDGATGATVENLHLEGFRVTSSVSKSSGAGIHLEKVGRASLISVIADGQDGDGNLWHGFWFDQVGAVRMVNFEAKAQEDGLRVNGSADGSGPIADLFLSHFKIESCTIGLHIGGGFGGLTASHCSIIANATNVKISQSIAARSNRAAFFDSTCAIDSATGVGVIIDDAGTGGITQYFQFDGTWIAGNSSHGIHIQNIQDGGKFSYVGGTVWANGGDGIFFDDTVFPFAIISDVFIRDQGGWGINSTNADTNKRIIVGDNRYNNNSSGDVDWTKIAPYPGTEFTVTIADDAAFSFIPGKETGVIWGADADGDVFQMVGYRANAGSRTTSIGSFGSFNVTTGALTGTTGADGFATISAHTDGKLYIENRIGSSQNFRISLQ